MTAVKELREKRNKLVSDARAIYDAASEGMTEEQTRSFDAMMDDADKLAKEIERTERLEGAERDLSASRGRVPASETRVIANDDALRGWLLIGSDEYPSDAQLRAMNGAGLTGNRLVLPLRSDALRSDEDFREWQNRAQAIGTGAAGGYTVAQGFSGEVERAMLAFGGVRSAARVLRTAQGNDIPWPLSDDTSNEAVIVAENTEIADTPDIVFGSTTLKSFKYTSNIVKVSTELLMDSSVDIAQIVGSMLGERVARGTNHHFTTGNGTTQPQGAVTGAHVSVTAAATDAITADEVTDLVHSVDAAYRQNAVFMLNDLTLKYLRKLKDSTGRPLFWSDAQSFSSGAPDTILGYRYVINNNMATIGAGAMSMLFGDFSRMIVRDAGPLILLRMTERYAEFGQVAFTVLSRHDSRVLDAGTHPICALQQAAS